MFFNNYADKMPNLKKFVQKESPFLGGMTKIGELEYHFPKDYPQTETHEVLTHPDYPEYLFILQTIRCKDEDFAKVILITFKTDEFDQLLKVEHFNPNFYVFSLFRCFNHIKKSGVENQITYSNIIKSSIDKMLRYVKSERYVERPPNSFCKNFWNVKQD